MTDTQTKLAKLTYERKNKPQQRKIYIYPWRNVTSANIGIAAHQANPIKYKQSSTNKAKLLLTAGL